LDIITTHTNTDLDGLASMVAARKLYPEAELVFPGKLSRTVEEFMALHKDALEVRSVKQIDLRAVRRLILVDTRNPGRLNQLAALVERPDVEVHIYDHHPGSEGDLRGQVEVIAPVGATTTLLVEVLRERGTILSPMEATILALGIYEDTGSLIFASTTPRDVAAVAWLLEKGANLTVVADFLGRPLTPEQNALLKALLVSAEYHLVNGVRVLIARGTVEEFIDGLALLTHKLAEIEQLDAVFSVVEMEDRVHVVARSSVPEVNAREVLQVFGGGGHQAAASATVKGLSVEAVVARLKEELRSRVRPPLKAGDIMSSPVKTVTRDTTIDEASRVMLRYGHTGLPVVEGQQLVGVISRRDVEKAMFHGLGHAPVKAYMSQRVITATPATPVAELQSLMITHNIGRLPVVEDGRLVGIVSRTDVLRTLHGYFQPRHQTVYVGPSSQACKPNLRELLERRLPPRILRIARLAGETGERLGYQVYAAGGVVRDLIMGMDILDLDLVVEGDGIALARALAEGLQGHLRTFEKFKTAQVLLRDGLRVDVATARVEFYEYPAALPRVESSTLHQDLYRRDFTINAMALALNPARFGELVDFFNGREDLQQGLVRVLHNLSFVEDPIRALRAVRFEQRYGFQIESQTLALLREAVRTRMLNRVSAERLWTELKYLMGESRAALILARLAELNIWPQVFPGVAHQEVLPALHRIPEAVNLLREWGWNEPAERWLPYFLGVVYLSTSPTAEELCRRYHLNRRQKEKVMATLRGWREIHGRLSGAGEARLSDLAGKLLALPQEAYPLLLALLEEDRARERFRQVLVRVTHNRPQVTGKDIKQLGFRPGPVFKEALEALWQARLDGQVNTREEELAFVSDFLRRREKVAGNV
jgi:tRNA nucleotidyltransferase (CCA-adding enzyme)